MNNFNTIKAIIVDDESLSISVIEEYLKPFATIEIIDRCTQSELAIEIIKTKKPDLLFLDIQMPRFNGFEVIEAVLSVYNPYVIFITAFDNYAIQAFETNAIGYILKPIDEQKFKNIIQKAITQLQQQNFQNLKELLSSFQKTDNEFLKRILIKEPNRFFYIPVEDVYFFEASGDYVNVVTAEKKYTINNSLSALENSLNPLEFARIHRSTIVNCNQIKEFKPYFNSEYILVLKNKIEVKVSRNYKENLTRIFKDL
ncbi:MAG: LytTR family DNA-binding domain-containing protein [Limnohabitans sp.]|nr:LytTR family DNA-binding domain-containing protein [Limnohabitans sp.]